MSFSYDVIEVSLRRTINDMVFGAKQEKLILPPL